MKCRFCASEAVEIYSFPKGCICYPNDRVQALCEQHIDKATPIDGMLFINSAPGVRYVKTRYVYAGKGTPQPFDLDEGE